MAPAQFAAGWFDGISHEDKRDDLYKCYSKNDDLTNALYDAMEAYIAGDSKTGDKLMKESKLLWDTALAGCGEIAKRMSYLSDEMDKIQKRSDWDQISKKIYDDNKPPIDLNVSDMLDNWKKGNYFESG